jgi:flavin-dependent dehydrogenase
MLGALCSTLLLQRQQSDTALLNSQNTDSTAPTDSNVVVVGSGIHSLIYAIHAMKIDLSQPNGGSTSITVLEKSNSPGYKIGESTLTVFGLWLKTVGIDSPLLWRLFGPKDGLAFYYLPQSGDPEKYTSFCANGPPGDFVPTLQIERKISELLLTLFAQRLGVKVLHGHAVDIDATRFEENESTVRVKNVETKKESEIRAQLVVDATGRFRRFASKASRIKRFEGWNTDAFWAYFECPGDESNIPLSNYESCNTNHICLAEGCVLSSIRMKT